MFNQRKASTHTHSFYSGVNCPCNNTMTRPDLDGHHYTIEASSIPDENRFSGHLSTKESTHHWMKGWNKNAFVPSFAGERFTDFLTLESFVKEANREVVDAIEIWAKKTKELLHTIEDAVGGRLISSLAFHAQTNFAEYVENKVVPTLKRLRNIPIQILNDRMLENMLIDPAGNLEIERRDWTMKQAVHLVGSIARATTFELLFVPFQSKRNFEIYTQYPEHEDGLPYGKEYDVHDYSNNGSDTDSLAS